MSPIEVGRAKAQYNIAMGGDHRSLEASLGQEFFADISEYNKTKGIDLKLMLEKNDTNGKIDLYNLNYSKKYNQKLSNIDVRLWYHNKIDQIPMLIDNNLPIEERAREAFILRGQIRFQAREMMKDIKLRKELDKSDPIIYDFEEFLENKMKRKGLSKEEALIDIIRTSNKSNSIVDKRLGLERRE